MTKLSEKKWDEVKIHYELGTKSIRGIADEFGISEASIRVKIKKENWTQKLRAQLIDLKQDLREKINNITQSCPPERLALVEEKIAEILHMQKAVNNFVKGAINLNIRNLQDALNEPDPRTRIVMANQMKATMADLAILTKGKPIFSEEQVSEKNEEVVINICGVRAIGVKE